MTKDRALRVLDVYASINGSGQCTQDEYEEAKKMAIKALEGKDTDVPGNVPDIDAGDTIYRQAAIDALNKEIIKRRLLDDVNDGMLDEFDTEDILRKLPSAQPEKRTDKRTETHACDLISRQWLMECVNEGWIKFETEKDKNKFIHLVRDTAPSAQPERKKGEWIDAVLPNDSGGLQVQVCDQCNTFFPLAYTGGGHNFCPNCGAKMDKRKGADE